MSRPLRLQFPGALYHITSRGNARQTIFLCDQDRYTFLNTLSHVLNRYQWLCHAYCLMDNHYHLLIETLEATLALGMRQLNGVYTQNLNHSHGRVGHLFQGRYKAILVEKEAHLLELCRYVVLNPVRARLISDPTDWPWSSFRATLGLSPKPPWLTTDWILAQFHSQRHLAQSLYQRFVLNGIDLSSPLTHVKGQIYLGSEQFCQSLAPGDPLEEIPRDQSQPLRPSLQELFASTSNSTKRLVLIAYRNHRYSMREIAHFLQVHYSTISRWVHIQERSRS